MNATNYINQYLKSVAYIIIIFIVTKIISVSTEANSLKYADPLLNFISTRQLLVIVCVIETIVYIIIINSNVNNFVKILSILWLSIIFIIYRAGLLLINQKNCNCLGIMNELFNISPNITNWLSIIVALYMLIGSLYFIIVNMRKKYSV
jgi:hypothetical protein